MFFMVSYVSIIVVLRLAAELSPPVKCPQVSSEDFMNLLVFWRFVGGEEFTSKALALATKYSDYTAVKLGSKCKARVDTFSFLYW